MSELLLCNHSDVLRNFRVRRAGGVLYAVVFPKVQAVKQFRIGAHQQGALTVKDDLAAAGLQADHVRCLIHHCGVLTYGFHASS